jgi:hypothetical protein
VPLPDVFVRCSRHAKQSPLRGTITFPAEDISVYDFAYIVGTMLFFALMLAYTAACARLGQRNPGDVAGEERSK